MLSFQGHADIARLYGGGEGKGIILAFVKDLCHNEFCRWLTAVQRVHVPSWIGSIDLDKPYYYNAGICIVNLTLVSWAGECLDGSKTAASMNGPRWTSDLVRAVNAIGAGVSHQNLRMPNLHLNEETRRIMVVGFERPEIVKAIQQALWPMPPNRRIICGAKEVDGKDNMLDTMIEDPII